MKCDEVRENAMSLYIDAALETDRSAELKRHLDECSDCRNEFYDLFDMVNELHNIQEVELPEGLHQQMMSKLRDNQEIPETSAKDGKVLRFMRHWKAMSGVAAVFLVLVISITVINNGGRKNTPYESATAESGDYADRDTGDYKSSVTNDAAAPSEMPQMDGEIEYEVAMEEQNAVDDVARAGGADRDSIGETQNSATANRKIIRNAYMDMRVKDLTTAFEQITARIESAGGYIESSNTYVYDTIWQEGYENPRQLKSGNLVVRVPALAYTSAKEMLKTIGEIDSSSESSQEVTAQYIDTEARLKVLKQEESRLLDIMAKADVVEDLIRLEQRLGVVRTDIESYQAMLNNWDRLTRFSTITLNIREEAPVTLVHTDTKDLITRINEGFIYSVNRFQGGIERMLVSAAENFIQLIFILIISVAAIIIIYRKLARYIKRAVKKTHDEK